MFYFTRKGLTTGTSANEITLYPNPVSNELFIEAGEKTGLSIKLYNMMGSLVLDQNIDGNQSINTGKLASGIYTYKIYQNNNEQKIGKLVISH